MKIDTVVVIGAGTMGRGIGHVFALHGFDVTLVDVKEQYLQAAYEAIDRNLQRQVKRDTITTAFHERALERISLSVDTQAAVETADVVIEAVPEDKNMKRELFGEIDAVAPEETILASNTSSISITWLGAQTARAERVVGVHFFNPVPMMDLVEVVRGRRTSDEVLETVRELVGALDKTAVEVNDSPGFVSNRVLMPMINEAVYCVMEGVADAEQVDEVMTLGMSHPMGPLRLADFIGLDVCLSILEVLHRELGEDKYRPCPLLRRMVDAGDLGRKTGRGFYVYT